MMGMGGERGGGEAAMQAGANMLTNDDKAQLRAYVMAPTSANQLESTVLLHVTHSNLSAKLMEIRFDRHTSIAGVKAKLVSHTGTGVSSMRLVLKDGNRALAELNEDDRPLGYYSPEDGYTIHVIDLDPTSMSAGGWLEDTSKVEKFELTDEQYNARDKSYRKFKAAKLKDDPEWCVKKEMCMRRGEEYIPPNPDLQKEDAEKIVVGSRCKVCPGDRRGTVRYVGRVEGLPAGYWIGVEYDEPQGKNDGTVKGVRLFECGPNYGAIVRPLNVEVGDFEEEDIDWDAIEEDEI